MGWVQYTNNQLSNSSHTIRYTNINKTNIQPNEFTKPYTIQVEPEMSILLSELTDDQSNTTSDNTNNRSTTPQQPQQQQQQQQQSLQQYTNQHSTIQSTSSISQMPKKYKRLNAAIAEMIEQYSMVSFIPLNITDEESINVLLQHIDNALQYGEDIEPHEPDDAVVDEDDMGNLRPDEGE
jgi:HD superfamily phosphohydrolase